MSQPPIDEPGLGATEAQMRRALGLEGRPASLPEPTPQPTSPTVTHRPSRRFVRDGEVPVSVIHRTDDIGAGTNKLEAVRQALAEQFAARERAEELLRNAEVAVRDLQTKLAHERIAHEEAARRVEGEMQAMRQAAEAMQEELAAERAARQKAEEDRDQTVADRHEAEEQAARQVSTVPGPVRPARGATKSGTARVDGSTVAVAGTKSKGADIVPTTDTVASTTSVKRARRHGQPPGGAGPDGDIVEWWKPGWREKFR